MRHSNSDKSIDLNRMPYLCEDSKSYLEISPKKEFTYHTPTSSPRGGALYIPETPEEVYSSYKERRPFLNRVRSARDEVFGSFDPALHGLLKSLLPRFLGKASLVKCKGLSSSKGDNNNVGEELTACSLEGISAVTPADADVDAAGSTTFNKSSEHDLSKVKAAAAFLTAEADESVSNSGGRTLPGIPAASQSTSAATSSPSQPLSAGNPAPSNSVRRIPERSSSCRCIRF